MVQITDILPPHSVFFVGYVIGYEINGSLKRIFIIKYSLLRMKLAALSLHKGSLTESSLRILKEGERGRLLIDLL